MTKYLEVIEELPKELQAPILKILQLIREDIANTVTKADFIGLKDVVRELAEAQKKTEIKLEELAEAQRKTEVRLNELAEAQKRTEVKLEELAEAQRKTEMELHTLVKDHANTKKMVGGLSNTIGFHLEDISYKGLPALLKKDYNVILKEGLIRKNILYSDGTYDQINIFGKGEQNGESVWIIGECKTQLSKKHIDNFQKLIQRLKQKAGYKKMITFFVTYYADPKVEKYIKENNIKVYYSYQF